jgi:hypothetical protein
MKILTAVLLGLVVSAGAVMAGGQTPAILGNVRGAAVLDDGSMAQIQGSGMTIGELVDYYVRLYKSVPEHPKTPAELKAYLLKLTPKELMALIAFHIKNVPFPPPTP